MMIAFIFALTMANAASSQPPAGMTTILVETTKGPFTWTIELASDDAARTKGLMHRKSMPQQQGMLFRFDKTRPIAMWMKNTFIALDMVFADEAGMITHIHHSAVPHSTDIISSNGPVRYVLEINAGQADAAGLQPGNHLRHPWFRPGKP